MDQGAEVGLRPGLCVRAALAGRCDEQKQSAAITIGLTAESSMR
jgi:hypothetical protein